MDIKDLEYLNEHQKVASLADILKEARAAAITCSVDAARESVDLAQCIKDATNLNLTGTHKEQAQIIKSFYDTGYFGAAGTLKNQIDAEKTEKPFLDPSFSTPDLQDSLEASLAIQAKKEQEKIGREIKLIEAI